MYGDANLFPLQEMHQLQIPLLVGPLRRSTPLSLLDEPVEAQIGEMNYLRPHLFSGAQQGHTHGIPALCLSLIHISEPTRLS